MSRPTPSSSRSTKDTLDDQRRPKFAARHTELLEIAAAVFSERGYDATTISDLVEATNLQRGGLYYYIGGKKELLLEIHRRAMEPLLEITAEISAADLPPDQMLREVARALMSTIERSAKLVAVFLHEWRVIENDPDWSELRQERHTYESLVESMLERGREEGLFHFADSRLTLMAFLGMLNYSYRWFDASGRRPAEEVADAFVDIFLRGLTSPTAGGV